MKQLGGHCPTGSKLTKKVTELFQGLYAVDAFKRKLPQDIETTGKSVEAKERGLPIVRNDDLDEFFLKNTGKSLTEHI